MYSSKAFYITLPSNVSSPDHHKNVTSEYTTYLPKALEFDRDNRECALVEISYPHSWDNIHPPFDTIKFQYYDQNENTITTSIKELPNSCYISIKEVVETINRIKPRGFRGNLGFEKKGREMVKIVLFQNEGIKLHKTLSKLLGFAEHSWEYKLPEMKEVTDLPDRVRIKAQFHGDIRALHYNLYVYSNIVQAHLCGTQYLPLLRTVNIEGSDGSYVTKIYEIPHYLPLSSDYIESINIKIADDIGQRLRFQYGKVICKLHFRRKSYLH